MISIDFSKASLGVIVPSVSIEILSRLKGKELAGKRYRPLFPFFKEQEGAFKIILEESVSAEDGTGIVHAAPSFGEVDFFACRRENIELVSSIDNNGKFLPAIVPYAGMFIKDADREIMRDLKGRGHLFY